MPYVFSLFINFFDHEEYPVQMVKSGKGSDSFIGFLFSKKFFRSLGLAVVLIIALVLLSMKFVGLYTRHGKEITVPVVYGMTMQEVQKAGYDVNFDFFIIDSLHDDRYEAGSVVIQDPLPGAKVKKGRNIYVSVVASSPETVLMPNLKDLTLRQALKLLTTARLRPGKLIYQPSFDKNAVLEQLYQGDTVLPGEALLKGSAIDLVIGTGDNEYQIKVPFLIGKTREEAIYDINIASFNLGKEVYLDSIMDNTARVYLQEPRWHTSVPYFPGDSIHLSYRSDAIIDYEEYIKVAMADTLVPDTAMAEVPEDF